MNSKPEEQTTHFLAWLAAAQIDRFDLAAIRFSNASPEGIFIPGPTKIGYSALAKSLSWLRYENRNKSAGAYIRPARGQDWPYIFFDDVTPSTAHNLADNHCAALVETSAGRFHAWLKTDMALSEAQRHAVQSKIAGEIGADMGSVSGEHWGRLPGFKNRKPNRPDWVNLRRLSYDGPPFVASTFEPHNPDANELHEQKRILRSTPCETDESAAEWKFVCSALEAGLPRDTVYQQLLEHCTPRRGGDARRYAEHTLSKALLNGNRRAGSGAVAGVPRSE
jgi:hypothetical protein